jgi:hypothetical protein
VALLQRMGRHSKLTSLPTAIKVSPLPSSHLLVCHIQLQCQCSINLDINQDIIVSNSTKSSHCKLSHNRPTRTDDKFVTAPQEVLGSYPIKRRTEDNATTEYKRSRMGFVDLHSNQILNSWYQNYIQSPNPTDNEVHELVQLSGLTRKQVK